METIPLALSLPAYMQKALQIIQRLDPNAIIGGGALRDTLLQRPVKDVDIFVRPGIDHFDLRDAFSSAQDPEILAWDVNRYDVACDEEGYIEFFKAHMQAVWDIHMALPGSEPGCVEDHAIQVIVMAQPVSIEQQLERFDLSFCRIAHDGNRTLATTDCLDSIARKAITVTLAGSDWRLGASLNRARRLQREKYQDFIIESPPGLSSNLSEFNELLTV